MRTTQTLLVLILGALVVLSYERYLFKTQLERIIDRLDSIEHRDIDHYNSVDDELSNISSKVEERCDQ